MPRNNGDWRKDSGTKCRKGASLLTERTLVILKPDALQRALAGEIISRLEKKGFILVGAKLFRFDEALCRRHYAHLVDKPFFPEIVDYMTSGPCLAMVWHGGHCVCPVDDWSHQPVGGGSGDNPGGLWDIHKKKCDSCLRFTCCSRTGNSTFFPGRVGG